MARNKAAPNVVKLVRIQLERLDVNPILAEAERFLRSNQAYESFLLKFGQEDPLAADHLMCDALVKARRLGERLEQAGLCRERVALECSPDNPELSDGIGCFCRVVPELIRRLPRAVEWDVETGWTWRYDGEGGSARADGPFRFDGRLVAQIEIAVTSLRAATANKLNQAKPSLCSPVSRPKIRLRIKGKTVFLDGKAIPLDLTPDRRDAVLCLLRNLIRMRGQWISGPDINRAEIDFSGIRWDRVVRDLPEPIRARIESNRKLGYRIILA
jgi:hypothetical protein